MLHLHLRLLLIHLRMLVEWMLLLRLRLAKLLLLLVVHLYLHLRVGRLAHSRHLCELALLVVHSLALSDNLLLLPLQLIVFALLFELPLRDARRICELGALPRRDERWLDIKRRWAPLIVGGFVARWGPRRRSAMRATLCAPRRILVLREGCEAALWSPFWSIGRAMRAP